MYENLTDQQGEEIERLLGYYEIHGALPFWAEDAVTLLRDLLPEWSAFKLADAEVSR